MVSTHLPLFCAPSFCLLVWLYPVAGAAAELQESATTICEGTQVPGRNAPTPAAPFPLHAAGWGPDARHGFQATFSLERA